VPVDIVNDVELVEKAIAGALTANAHVLKKPEPSVGISALQEYTMVMFVRGYVVSRDYWLALPSIQKDVKQAMDKAGIPAGCDASGSSHPQRATDEPQSAAYGRFAPVNQAFAGLSCQITLKKLDVNHFCTVLTIY